MHSDLLALNGQGGLVVFKRESALRLVAALQSRALRGLLPRRVGGRGCMNGTFSRMEVFQ
jgi:hypothetical protein